MQRNRVDGNDEEKRRGEMVAKVGECAERTI